MSNHMVSRLTSGYIVSPFRPPMTPVLEYLPTATQRCPVCGNDNQEKFWLVTSLGGTELQGIVCAPCEDRASKHTT